MFIVWLTYKVELTVVEQHLAAHIEYLNKYYAQGNFIASGRKVPRTGGVILANALSRQALDAILQEDPFYIEDIAEFEVTEFIPTMTADAFEGLKQLD